jgi:NitT/TauT family transport system substrate-binding protein
VAAIASSPGFNVLAALLAGALLVIYIKRNEDREAISLRDCGRRGPSMQRVAVFDVTAIALLASLAAMPAARADDTLKVAIGQTEAWAQQPPILGQQAGFFKKQGIVLENFATQGAGETLQTVISGAADIGIGIGTVGVMRAFAKGAPVRIFGASFTGMGDIFWYVKADSPLKRLADATDKTTIAYSTNGATSHSVVLAFAADLGVKAKPTATGGLPSTLTQVMSGQIDIGWAVAPFGLKEAADGQIRIIASGNDVPSMRGQTARVQTVNAEVLAKRKDVLLRFVRAYRESLDWLFTDPQAIKSYAAQNHVPEALVRETADKFQTRQGMQFDQVSGVDQIMADGVALKFLDAPLSKQQLGELIQIPAP